METKLMTIPGERTKITKAIEQLSCKELPKVWIKEENHDEGSEPYAQAVDFLSLNEYKPFIADDFLSPRDERILFERSLHILAAQQNHAVVKKILPKDGINRDEAFLIANFRRSLVTNDRYSYQWGLDPASCWPDPANWVHEDTILILDFPPDRHFPLETSYFYRLIHVCKLSSEHRNYIEDLYFCADVGLSKEYSIPATDTTKWIANSLAQINNL